MPSTRSGPLYEGVRRIRSMLFAPQIILAVVAIVTAYVLLFVGELAGLKSLGIRTNGSVLAFLLGFVLATFLCVVLYVVIVFTGAANYLTGGLAEKWTTKEFTVLGSGWHIFTNVPFSVGFDDRSYTIDVDHIVVGPYGVLVLETKFSSSPIDLGAIQVEKRVSEAMVQVEDNAGRVRALLWQVSADVPIRPVVIFWGRSVRPPKGIIRRVAGKDSDIRIVHGGEARKWRPRLTEKVVMAPEIVNQLSAKIEGYISSLK